MQMARLDALQAVRHDQLMRLNLRSDQLKLRRFVFPMQQNGERALREMAEAWRDFASKDHTAASGHEIKLDLENVFLKASSLKECVINPSAGETRELWSAEMVETERRLNSAISQLMTNSMKWDHITLRPGGPMGFDDRSFLSSFREQEPMLPDQVELLRQVAGEFMGLAIELEARFTEFKR
ncbi:MAG: hypothetical protein U1A06_11760 [Hoeflea sp.]|nr:hypothetical protein [Hoeflea sp.]